MRVDGPTAVECTQAAPQVASAQTTPDPTTPPRPTPQPARGCEPGDSNPPDAEYAMTLRAEEDGGIITVYAGIDDRGGGNYQAAQWSICRSTTLGFIGVEPAPGAPEQCHLSSESERTLLGCIDLSGEPVMDTFGDIWIVRYQCLRPGEVRIYLGREQTFLYDSPSTVAPTTIQSTQVTCTQPAPGMTPSPTITVPDYCRLLEGDMMVCWMEDPVVPSGGD
jgi:hypothetical protein